MAHSRAPPKEAHPSLQYQCFPSTLDTGVDEKSSSRLQQWRDQKSYPLTQKSLLPLSGSQVWMYMKSMGRTWDIPSNAHEFLHPYMTFFVISYGKQQGILFSQSQTSRSHSSFLNHTTSGKWFLSKLCLSLAFSPSYLNIHTETHRCLYLKTGRLLFWLPFKCLLMR